MIDGKDRLCRIGDSRSSDLLELRDHRTRIIMGHYVTWANGDKIATANDAARSESISVACSNLFDQREPHKTNRLFGSTSCVQHCCNWHRQCRWAGIADPGYSFSLLRGPFAQQLCDIEVHEIGMMKNDRFDRALHLVALVTMRGNNMQDFAGNTVLVSERDAAEWMT